MMMMQMVTRTKKIFVGGLSAPSTVDDVKGYFEQFGRVRLFLVFFYDVKSLGTRLVTKKELGGEGSFLFYFIMILKKLFIWKEDKKFL
jgi:RNA recognition motif-containing protein